MNAPLSAREHALRIAALEALASAVAAEYEHARREAEPVFAAKYEQEGNDRQLVLLPDGERISQLTIKSPSPSARFRDGAIEKWAAEVIGDGAFEEYVLPAAIGTRQVIDAVKAAHPELVKTRLRPATAKKLADQAVKGSGWLKDEETGAKEQVADLSPGTCTGAFAFTGNDKAARHGRIMAELLAGRLRGVVGFGPLALPGGDGDE